MELGIDIGSQGGGLEWKRQNAEALVRAHCTLVQASMFQDDHGRRVSKHGIRG